MMPFAFDLISTLVIGSILPVATTERTMAPRSTVTILEGSTAAAAPRVDTPHAAAPTTTMPAAPRVYLRDVFMGCLPVGRATKPPGDRRPRGEGPRRLARTVLTERRPEKLPYVDSTNDI